MNDIQMPTSRNPSGEEAGFVHLFELNVAPEAKPLRASPRLAAACLDRAVPLQTWWEEEALYWFSPDAPRKSHVLSLANKDGAHFDPVLNEADLLLRNFCDFEVTVTR